MIRTSGLPTAANRLMRPRIYASVSLGTAISFSTLAEILNDDSLAS